jgi:GT2 family glycosyltransferase
VTKLIFLIVNFNQYDFCVEYVKNIYNAQSKSDKFEVQIFICDNSDNEQHRALLARTIRSGEVFHIGNIGYLKGLQAAFAKAQEYDTEDSALVIMSNPDISLPADFYEKLHDLNILSKDGICGPKIIANGRNQNPNKVKKPSRLWYLLHDLEFSNYAMFVTLRAIKRGLKLLKDLKNSDNRTIPDFTEVYLLHGSFMITTIENIERTSLFDYDIFLWGEEAVIAHSFREQGMKICYVPTLEVFHNEHASTGLLPAARKYGIWKKSYRVYREFL